MSKKQGLRGGLAARVMAVFASLAAFAAPCAHAQRTVVAHAGTVVEGAAAQAPVSAPVDATLVLQGSPEQQAALRALLAEQTTPGTVSYHQWLTPADFAERFQPSAAEVESVRSFFASQGIVADRAGASRTSLRIHGTVAQMQGVFAVQIVAKTSAASTVRFATADLTLPNAIAPLVANVEGLYETSLSPSAENTLQAFALAVESNKDAVLTIAGATACDASEAASLRRAFTPALQQAAAQGITVLASGACVTHALAPATGLVTAVHLNGDALDSAVSLASDGTERPGWQVAEGLPESSLRALPDLSVDGDIAALAAAFRTIAAKAGTRQGSANAELYALAGTKGIYSHANATLGTWQPGTGLGTVSINDLIEAWPNGTSTSNISLSSSSYSPAHGTDFTLTAVVTGTGQNAVPTGTVTFQTSQGTTVGTATLSGTGSNTATASYKVVGMAGGTYTFSATYPGDGNFAAASSSASPAIVTVTPEASSLAASTGTASVGGTIPVSITVTSASGVGTPTGSVVVTPQGTSNTASYTGTLVSTQAGKATAIVNVPTTQAGTIALQVNCSSPNSSFSCNSPISVQATVDKGTPGITLSFTPTSSTNTGSGTLKATLAGVTGAAAPSGTVDFYDGSTKLGSGTITSGVATYTASVTGATAHSITAVYAGDTNYLTATSNAVNVAGTLISTTTSLSASSYTPTYGQSITLNSNVTPASTVNGTAPTGTITFKSSLQGDLGNTTYTGTAVSFPITTLQAGTHSLTATYSGDGNYAASTSTSSVVVTVAPATATLAATISPTTAIGYGTTASINATVTTASGGAPSGTLTATIAGVNGATYTATLIPATSNSTATFTIPSPPPGTYSITVACSTNTNFTCSNTVTLPLTVTRGSTTTTVSMTPTAPQAGSKVTLTASVGPSSGSGSSFAAPTGTVTFFDGNVSLGTASLAGGTGSISVALNGKTHTITATYSGDTNWLGSTSAAQTVTPSPIDATIALTASNLSPLAGANVVLTATVTAPSGASIIPTGLVSFYDVVNGVQKLLGTATLISNGLDGGSASISTTGLIGGAHSVYATYAGDVSFNPARSASISLAAADFTLTMVPNTLTMTRGTAAVATGIVTMQGGFNGNVTLGCQPPAGAASTCSFAPSTVSGGGTALLNIITTSAGNNVPHRPGGRIPAGVAFAAILCGAMFRRRLSRALIVAIVSFAAISTLGCANGVLGDTGGTTGGGSGGGTGTGGTPYGTLVYTLTAAASDGATTVRHQYYYQVTVQ